MKNNLAFKYKILIIKIYVFLRQIRRIRYLVTRYTCMWTIYCAAFIKDAKLSSVSLSYINYMIICKSWLENIQDVLFSIDCTQFQFTNKYLGKSNKSNARQNRFNLCIFRMFGEETRVRWPLVASQPLASLYVWMIPNYALHTLPSQSIKLTIR